MLSSECAGIANAFGGVTTRAVTSAADRLLLADSSLFALS